MAEVLEVPTKRPDPHEPVASKKKVVDPPIPKVGMGPQTKEEPIPTVGMGIVTEPPKQTPSAEAAPQNAPPVVLPKFRPGDVVTYWDGNQNDLQERAAIVSMPVPGSAMPDWYMLLVIQPYGMEPQTAKASDKPAFRTIMARV